ncbi:MBL fold metallo-hydrolase [Ammoniphilus sp. YIM 78166]|uniref:MBL fold metallo-hydrolase n=1 Tax=Ammoniphilus sp. YIM 78166 TaxID=1644106 RepID=UPI00106F6036|nr:MBL fold metallo-hydrolase [Ammoniphilus sp. YIM 78166]
MSQNNPIDLGHRIHLIDGYDLGVPGRTGAYCILEDQLTIVETSASPSVPYILEGFRALGLNPLDLKYIIVTHIHLDHAGGAGLLLQSCPNAKVVVHPKGARHLAKPERLIQGARAVYGEDFDRLFDPILPVPEDKLIIKADGETLEIGPNCTLQFLDTPGHANHHFSIYDPVSKGIFTGDTVGVYYHQLADNGLSSFTLPSTSPNQFNPEAMLASMKRIQETGVERIYFGHFGVHQDPSEVYQHIEEWLPVFVEAGRQVVAENKDVKELSSRLYDKVSSYLIGEKVPADHPVFALIKMDLDVCSMGLIEYVNKMNA